MTESTLLKFKALYEKNGNKTELSKVLKALEKLHSGKQEEKTETKRSK